MRMIGFVATAALVAGAAGPLPSLAVTPTHYSGRLLDSCGQPALTGDHLAALGFFDAESAGNLMCGAAPQTPAAAINEAEAITMLGGHFSVAIPPDCLTGAGTGGWLYAGVSLFTPDGSPAATPPRLKFLDRRAVTSATAEYWQDEYDDGGSTAPVNGLTVTITTDGSPIELTLSPRQAIDAPSGVYCGNHAAQAVCAIKFRRTDQSGNASIHGFQRVQVEGLPGTASPNKLSIRVPSTSFRYVDHPPPGTYTYQVYGDVISLGGNIIVSNTALVARVL